MRHTRRTEDDVDSTDCLLLVGANPAVSDIGSEHLLRDVMKCILVNGANPIAVMAADRVHQRAEKGAAAEIAGGGISYIACDGVGTALIHDSHQMCADFRHSLLVRYRHVPIAHSLHR